MATIFVEGLGNVEIQGDTPTAEERAAIENAFGSSSTDIKEQETVKKDLESEDIAELIDPNLAEVGKAQPKGLEKIGIDRPVFEAAGAIFGSVPGASLGPAGIVAGGTLGATGAGQLYDVLQSAITDETTDFGTQAERAKKDLSREALLQTFFAKIPGMWTGAKKFIWGKPDKSLYDSAKKIGFPLSLSDSGNVISTGYGKVIGVFPYVGGPIKTAAGKKTIFLNKTAERIARNQADDTLNTFAPNVTLSKLGIDMSKAAQVTYGDFRRVSGFFYDDFYKAVDKIGNTPVISTKHFKNSLQKYVQLINNGTIKGVKSPQKDKIYQYAKKHKKIPEYITATQYKSLKEDLKYFARLSKKEPFNIKVLTGLKSSLETDLRLLNKQSYQDNLLKNVYPLSKSKKNFLDPELLSDIATRLKFADKVYATGLENSLITSVIKKHAQKEGVKLVPIPGKQIFEKPTANIFKKVDKNIFGAGFKVPGSLNADELGEALLKRHAGPTFLKDLRTLVGEKQYNKFVSSKLQQAYNSSLIQSGKAGSSGLKFNPYKFEESLGMDTVAGRDLLEEMLKGSKITLDQLDSFFNVAKNHAGLKIPDVSSFVARRAVLGGTKSLIGGVVMGAGITTNPLIAAPLIYMARKTSGFLANPKALDDVVKVFDPNSTASQMKVSALKLMDALISDSQNRIEKNELSLYKEYLELMPLSEVKKGMEDALKSSEQFLNMDESSDVEEIAPSNTDDMSNIKDNQSQLPTPPLETPNINPASFDKTIMAQGTVDQTGLTSSEQAFLDDEEKAMALRNRGMTA